MNAEHRSPPPDWLAHAQYEAGKVHGCAIGGTLVLIVCLIIGWLVYAAAHLPGW